MEGKEGRGEGGRRGVGGEMEGKEGGARVGGEGWKGRWRCMGEEEMMGRRVGKKLGKGMKCRHSER